MTFFHTNTDITILKLNKKLKNIMNKGIPLAAANTLDNMAFESRKESIDQFKKDHIIRSNWTQRGMLFQKTKRGIPIMKMESKSGNTRDYALELEEGATIKANKQFLPVPALGARSGNKRKRISARFKMNRLSNLRRMPQIAGSPNRKFAAMLNLARKENDFGPFLVTKDDAGGERLPVGIFTLAGYGRKKRGGGTIKMIRKLKKSVRVPSNPFIKPAGMEIGRRADKIYIKQANRIMNKFK